MIKELRGLAKESLIYGLSTVLGRMMSFLLTPLLTHILTRSESGVVQTLYSCIAFLTVLYGLGLDVAYLRLGRGDPRTEESAFASAWVFGAALALVVSALIYFFAARVCALFGLPPSAIGAVRVSAGILAIDALALIPFTHLRAVHHATRYAAIKTFSIAVNLILAWVFVRGRDWGVEGIFWANLIASAASLVLLLPTFLKARWKIDLTSMGLLARFGLPLAVALLGSMVVQVADRPIMTRLVGLEAAGLYGNCYKLGIFMSLLVGMFDQAWKPFILERGARPDVDNLVAHVLTHFTTLACGAFLMIAFFVRFAVTAPLWNGASLFHPSYWAGLGVVPVVTLGYLFNGIYFVLLAPLLIDKRTKAVGIATWLGAIVNIGANLWWIPRYSLMGAAWATCAAYVAMALAVALMIARRRKLPYEFGRLSALAAWTAALWATGECCGLIARVAVIAAYPAGLYAVGFWRADEISEFSEIFRRRANRFNS